MKSTIPLIKRVLLIDDDEDDCLVFKLALEEISENIQLHYATHFETIAGLIDAVKPDLLFLDINLPRTNGLACLQKINEGTIACSAPIVMYSSSELPRNLMDAYNTGATLYFRKPSDVTTLIRSLQAILSMPWHSPESIKGLYCSNGRYKAFEDVTVQPFGRVDSGITSFPHFE